MNFGLRSPPVEWRGSSGVLNRHHDKSLAVSTVKASFAVIYLSNEPRSMPTVHSMMVSFYLPLFLLPSLASAFSFNFESTPRQCQTLNISITGSGQPPYSVIIVPFGASPLPNNTEVRKIFQQNFTSNATSISFQLPYPADSQFVAVVRTLLGKEAHLGNLLCGLRCRPGCLRGPR